MIEMRIKIPDGVAATVEEKMVKVKGSNGEVSRELSYPYIKIKKENNEMVIVAEKNRRAQKAMLGTFVSHINNMINGVTQGFEYKMKVVYSHFPITVKISGKDIVVENFLGEKTPRKTVIVGKCAVKVTGQEISVMGNDVEQVGQTVSNIERITKVKYRDRRVFQDGIYLIERDGVKV